MTDEHRDVESVPTVGGGGLSVDAFTQDIFAEFACSKTLKLPQMKKLPNGPVASKQGAHSSVKSVGTLEASIQKQAGCNQHELLPFDLSFAENVDTNDIETQTEVFAASTQLTYGSVLEKMEAGRSTKALSWEFSCARSAKHKPQEIPNPPPLPVKGITFAAEQRRLRPIDDLRYIVKHWALSSPQLPKNDAFLGSRQNLLRIVLDLLDEAALIRHINKRCSQNCTFPPPRPALPVADEATSHFASACTASTGAGTCSEATQVKKEETGCGNTAAMVAWMRAPEDGDQKNIIYYWGST